MRLMMEQVMEQDATKQPDGGIVQEVRQCTDHMIAKL